MCGAPGDSVGASTRQWGVESCHGAENSALKNMAPFRRTPLRTSENASIALRDARPSFVAPLQSILAAPDARPRTSTARAWPTGRAPRRIIPMTRAPRFGSFLLAALCAAAPVSAQSALSLAQAIARARAHNPDAGAAAAAEREAVERVTQARAGYFPRVDVSE